MDTRLAISDVTKVFPGEAGEVEVLSGVTLAISAGESLSITGQSGSGKSTLLHLIGTLDTPTAGTVTFDDEDPFSLPEPALARFRNERIGFVFQDHHLLPQYSVTENVLIPALPFRTGGAHAEKRATELIDRVGLSHRASHRPGQLSGGERQRVAVARALINGPGVLLCDEPTGNLDPDTADAVADLLLELHSAERTILIVVTHSLELAARFGRHVRMESGKCVEA
ncbi:ABC transporter ATP-binding protein [Candidatus Poribacteria bacterium]|jgi:lipoprotein-releasing system ATP-binding protein|nr:ABC transporter ATP-binding protein [Candidatus Poribacteria bacterium]MBT5534564.1 ABC transporter ATP-binding protein [Candidatus Poribacteria bacterium]MBT5714329.1 ABC transporter ATP-binding protein [Candidatus Poribacteria bacterium]MBT7099869.1 ABC transporter ATP-binding protein [Candidatus Poribacteria bacterium]MBT7804475.1 ABC transporter ATP-binding protein [Candidatus Poribacteria bacterium]